MIKYLVCFFIAYLIGSISGSFILGKIVKGIDIRQHGSGNAGTTNAIRTMGKTLGVATFVIDFFKGLLSMYFLTKIIPSQYAVLIAIFCVIGHNYPFYMSFKGGKGIATSLGCLVWINPLLTLLGVVAGVCISLITKYVSVGSMTFLFVSTSLICINMDLGIINEFALIFLCILGIYRHKSNIVRLKSGRENKIGGLKWIK